jgi:hypothetical protein
MTARLKPLPGEPSPSPALRAENFVNQHHPTVEKLSNRRVRMPLGRRTPIRLMQQLPPQIDAPALLSAVRNPG